MHNERVRNVTRALAFCAVAATGCGGPVTINDFVGTWEVTGGKITADCPPKAPEDEQSGTGGTFVVELGSEPGQLVMTPCSLNLTVAGNVATLAGPQDCQYPPGTTLDIPPAHYTAVSLTMTDATTVKRAMALQGSRFQFGGIGSGPGGISNVESCAFTNEETATKK
jgi:hypothetical protein